MYIYIYILNSLLCHLRLIKFEIMIAQTIVFCKDFKAVIMQICL